MSNNHKMSSNIIKKIHVEVDEVYSDDDELIGAENESVLTTKVESTNIRIVGANGILEKAVADTSLKALLPKDYQLF